MGIAEDIMPRKLIVNIILDIFLQLKYSMANEKLKGDISTPAIKGKCW